MMLGREFEEVPLDVYAGVDFCDDDHSDEVYFCPEIEHGLEIPAITRAKRQVHTSLPMAQQFLELPQSAKGSVIGKLAGVISERLEFPEVSAFMALISSASAAVACAYSTQYKTGSVVALGMYTIIEQPPATQKSYLLNLAGDAYAMAIDEHNARVRAKNIEMRERDKDVDKSRLLKPAFGVTTDATSASMDMYMSRCSEGRFVVASAEQSALSSLFPESGTYSSNNELLLKGYSGEYVSGMRSGREAFAGVAQGVIVIIAQPGSCRRVLAASQGTGLAERFMFIAEPSMLGIRELRGTYPGNEDTGPFQEACRKCVALYSDRVIAQAYDDPREVMDPHRLQRVRPTLSGYGMILDKRREFEARLGNLSMGGDNLSAGWIGKYETHVIKIAGVIHVIENMANGCYPSEQIPNATVSMAMDIVDMLSLHFEDLMREAGESGSEAETDCFVDILSQKPLSKREVLLKAKNRRPYKGMGRNAYAAATERLESLISSGVLVVNTKGRIEVV
jgi:hypothetical protein